MTIKQTKQEELEKVINWAWNIDCSSGNGLYYSSNYSDANGVFPHILADIEDDKITLEDFIEKYSIGKF